MYQLEEIKEIVGGLPDDKSNPVDMEAYCLYVDKDGNHCIAGEVFSILGLDEYANYGRADVVELLPGVKDKFNLESVKYLNNLQGFADWASTEEKENPWGFAKYCVGMGYTFSYGKAQDWYEEYEETL